MTTSERREWIVRRVQTAGKVKVSELAERFSVSEVSIRSDLVLLEREGHLKRVHGGAVGKLYINMNVNERYTTNSEAKRSLAARVAEYIEDDDILMMNAGTTLVYVLQELRNRKRENVRIVTNSVQNAMEANNGGCGVTLLGGQLDSKYLFTYGQDTVSELSGYHANKCILSLDGISAAHQLTLYYPNETEVIRKMMENADKVIVAADSSKIGVNSFSKVADLCAVDCFVTNGDADPAEVEAIRRTGVTVDTCGPINTEGFAFSE